MGELENIMQSERIQLQKSTCYMTPIWGVPADGYRRLWADKNVLKMTEMIAQLCEHTQNH